jgi:hypothetical protein
MVLLPGSSKLSPGAAAPDGRQASSDIWNLTAELAGAKVNWHELIDFAVKGRKQKAPAIARRDYPNLDRVNVQR